MRQLGKDIFSRRRFVELLTTLGVLPAIPTADERVETDSMVEQVAADSGGDRGETESPTVEITSGKRVVDQAAFDDGTRPAEPPTYETLTESVTAETWLEIRAVDEATSELHDALGMLGGDQLRPEGNTNETTEQTASAEDRSGGNVGGDDFDLGPFSITTKTDPTTAEAPTFMIDCPEDVDAAVLNESTAEQLLDRVATRVEDSVDTEALDEERLGEFLETIDITFRNRPDEIPESGCDHTVGRYADTRYRERGIAMGSAVRSETRGAIASSGFRGLRDGYPVMITTAHTFYDRQSTPYDAEDLLGSRLYQAERPYAVGHCRAIEHGDRDVVDAAAVAVDTETYPSRFLADPGSDNYDETPIVGTASWDLLKTYQAEGRPIYKQGAVSGRCEGTIEELREFDNGYRELSVDVHSTGGDSGGPYFIRTDEGLLIAAIHKGVLVSNGLRVGIFVGSVREALGVDIY